MCAFAVDFVAQLSPHEVQQTDKALLYKREHSSLVIHVSQIPAVAIILRRTFFIPCTLLESEMFRFSLCCFTVTAADRGELMDAVLHNQAFKSVIK